MRVSPLSTPSWGSALPGTLSPRSASAFNTTPKRREAEPTRAPTIPGRAKKEPSLRLQAVPLALALTPVAGGLRGDN